MALKLLSDLSQRRAMRTLRDADERATLIHLLNDPVAVESLVRQQRIELEPLDQGRDADCIVAVARQELEAREAAERIG